MTSPFAWREYHRSLLRVGPEIFGKDVELLRDVIPQVRHMPLSNSAGPSRAPMITDVKIVPDRLGVAHGPMAYSTSHSLPVVLGFVRGRG